jgi:hypothetical protein
VRRLSDEANRWLVAEAELRAMLNGVAGANLIRRQRIALIAGQAFNIGTQLARDPANAVLVPHLEEVKRLKSIKRRKHSAPAPDAGTGTSNVEDSTNVNVMGGRETGRVQARPVISPPVEEVTMRAKDRELLSDETGRTSRPCTVASGR